MKKIFAIIIFILILTGCAEENNFTEKQQAACDLVKELVVFQVAGTEKTEWVQCFLEDSGEFIPNDNRWVAISPKPSKKHPNYENYLKNKKVREENNMPEPPSTLLIDTENQIILDPNVGGDLEYLYFQKTDEGFERPTNEEIVEIYGSDVYGDAKK
jgi:hypothetical protein